MYLSAGSVGLINDTLADDVAAGAPAGAGGMGGTPSTSGSQPIGGSNGGAYGGALWVGGGIAVLINSTVADNGVADGGLGGGLDVSTGTATLDNTIVALNVTGSGGSGSASDIAGTVASDSAYNLIGVGGSGGLADGINGNQVGVANPGLDPNGLQNNGGPTQTIALLPGSPAIGAGSDSIPGVSVPTTDQRGIKRPTDHIDIGAFQDRGFQLTLVAGSSPQRTAVNTAFPNAMAVTVTSPYGDPVAGGVISFAVSPTQAPPRRR